MILHPKALRELWPKTPLEFFKLYVNGDFDPAGPEYEPIAIRYGVDANRFGAVKVPYSETLGWEYLSTLCRDLSYRTEWAQMPRNSDLENGEPVSTIQNVELPAPQYVQYP